VDEPRGIIRLERLDALGDAVFAFAMTLLVINLELPEGFQPQNASDLLNALLALGDSLVAYIISFVVLAAYWMGRATRHAEPKLASAQLVWWTLIQLFFVTLVPFTTMVVGRYSLLPGVWVYGINMIFIALVGIRVAHVSHRESGEQVGEARHVELWTLAASAILSMLLSTLGAGSNSMWAYLLNAAPPIIHRILGRPR
jgi:uncharacterized membrane protein